MTELVEVRSTINMPGLPAGRFVRVDPSVEHIAMCLEAGYLVPTGRKFSVPSQNARGAVRPTAPSTAPESRETAKPAKRKRKKAAPRVTRPS